MVAGVVVTRQMVEVGVAYLAKSPLRSRCFRHTSLLRRIAATFRQKNVSDMISCAPQGDRLMTICNNLTSIIANRVF